ncbi:MAG: uroporphyrinogen III methyltransferase [Acidimicrobiales bacterium]|nr:MAG: uroporphyrinogen III methyltransferase [Acidimicrobiales bacterium]
MTVYLVGAGPGDPGLITVRGAEVLSRAEVVVYDRLAARELLDLAPQTSERIDVGKSPGKARLTQEEINTLLVERGLRGEEVVRLKGGDPFVFARGGEEVAALAEAGVPFEVVPGITSAIAVPAYAGVPVTLRHSSTLFTVVTGHEDPRKGSTVDWGAVARLGGTLVLLMAAARLREIAEELLEGGTPPDTPVVAVTWGTTPRQRTVHTTVAGLRETEVDPPVTVVIGSVAAKTYPWFESRPLFGKRVVLTRPEGREGDMTRLFREAGAEVIHVPMVRICDPPGGEGELAAAASRVSEYGWLVFTSATAVPRLMRHLRDARALAGVKVACIGPATAEEVRRHGVEPDLIPDEAVAESLAEALLATGEPPGTRVLLPRAAEAREVLVERLRREGWRVDVVVAYATEPAEVDADTLRRLSEADVVCFTSSSTVRAWSRLVGHQPPVVACIGPVTAATAEAVGMAPTVVAGDHTGPGLVDAVVRHFRHSSGPSAAAAS